MAKPLLDIHCVTEPYCDYPVAVKILMDDGTVQTYELKNKTDYQFNKVMNALAKMQTGYQYMGEHRKSRIHKSKL